MYDIYIMNYRNASGSLVTSERLLYSVPITQPELALNDPAVKLEMGKTGSFEFGINPLHSFYNAWNQMKTVMRVVYDGTTIFRGRVLTIDNSPMTGEKKIHLEGDFAFFMDSIQPSSPKEEDRSEISCLSYLASLVNRHNSQMDIAGEGYKKIYLGEVPGQYSGGIPSSMRVSTENRKFGETSRQTTADALSKLQSEFGGYFRTRYSGGTCYLDWFDYCFNSSVNGQTIEIKENLIDLSSTTEVENLFTALIPIGSNEGNDVTIEGYKTDVHGNNDYILVPHIVSQFPDSELNKGYHSKAEYQNAVSNYGIIFKTQSFGNADTQEKLWNYAIDWIKNNYIGGISSFSISALDRHHIDLSAPKYLLGDLVRVRYPNINAHTNGNTPVIEKILTLTSITYKLYTPDQNEYNVGIPNSVISKTYGYAKKKTTSSGGGSSTSSDMTAGGGGGIRQTEEDLRMTVQEMEQKAWKYVVDGYYNNKLYEELRDKDPKTAQRAVNFSEAVVLRQLMDFEDPDGEYTQATKDRIAAIYVGGVNSEIKLAGYMPGPLAVREKDRLLSQLKVSESITLNGYVGQWTVQDHMMWDEQHPVPIPYDPKKYWTDEHIAAYITWKDINAKDLFRINRNQIGNFGGYLQTKMEIRTNMLKYGIPDPDDPLGLTSRDYWGSGRFDASTGSTYAFQNILTANVDNPEVASIIHDGLEGVSKWVNTIDFGDGTVTAAIDAVKGALTNQQVLVGLDGTGKKAVIDIDGMLSGISMKNVIDAGSTDPKKVTVDLTGAEGALGLGKDEGANWIVTANKKIQYEEMDEEGHIVVRVINGGVHATDFHVNAVGSFATKFAAIDTLIAKKAFIEDLEAERARITDLEVTSGEMQADLSTIEGSALWTRRDNITGVVGEFEIKQDASGKDILVVKSGGGFRINRNNVEYGIYDNGNLTGGIMVDKINENTTVTKIKGDRVDIEAGQVRIGDTSNVETWMEATGETLDEYSGLIAARATIGQLNALKATVESLDADWISSKIGEINILIANALSVKGGTNLSGSLTVGGTTTLNGSLMLDSVSVGLGVYDVKITQSGNNYTLQKQTYSGSGWTDVGTFSRAVSSIDWSWSNGAAKAVVNPQGQIFYSPSYESWSASGDPTYDKDTKLLKRKFIFEDTEGNTMFSDDIMIPANIVEDQYKLADVWIQGTGEAVWIPVSSGGATYYAAGSQQTLYEKGSSYTTVKGSGSWFYTRGSSVTPSKKTGNNRGTTSATLTYRKVYNSSGTDQGYHWVTTGTSGSPLMYSSGGPYTYYDVGSDSTLYNSGSYVHMYDAGDSVTAIGTERKITPISSTSIQVAPGVRYTQGTHYTNRYYTKS